MLDLELSVTLGIFLTSGKQGFSSSLNSVVHSGNRNLFQIRNDFTSLDSTAFYNSTVNQNRGRCLAIEE